MYEVGLVLREFVDAFDDVPLAWHCLVPDWHELVPHVCFQFVYEVYVAVGKFLKKFPPAVSPVGKTLP